MVNFKKIYRILVTCAILSMTKSAHAQMSQTQQQFQDLFATAGYGTAFGAAMGAATLPFQKHPERKLRSVAIGASIGFIAGSLAGGYMIFTDRSYADVPKKVPSFAIQPILDDSLNLEGIEGSYVLARF